MLDLTICRTLFDLVFGTFWLFGYIGYLAGKLEDTIRATFVDCLSECMVWWFTSGYQNS